MNVFPRNPAEAMTRTREILHNYSGEDFLTFANAIQKACRESTIFIRREELFADGTGPGVDIYQYAPELGYHALLGSMTEDVAERIHGKLPVWSSLPEGVRIRNSK